MLPLFRFGQLIVCDSYNYANVDERTQYCITIVQQSILESSLALLGYSKVISFVCILIKVYHEGRLEAACIAIALSLNLLQSEYSINAIDGINNLNKM